MRADIPFQELRDRFDNLPIPNKQISNEIDKLVALIRHDPEMATVRGRRIVDSALREIFSEHIEPAGTRPLEYLITELEKRHVLPREIAAHSRSLKDIANLAAHELAISQEGLNEESIMVCLIDLVVILKWYARYLEEHARPVEPKFQAVKGIWLSERFPEAERLVEIDSVVYGGVGDEDRATPALCRAWWAKNPQIYTVLKCGREIVGYYNVMPLEEEAFRMCMSGHLRDGTISPDMIRSLELPGSYPLYVVSVAILPAYRRYGLAFRALYDAFFEDLFAWAKQDVFVTDIVANGWTEAGAALCRSFGMAHVGPHVAQGQIYHCTLIPPSVQRPVSKLKLLLEAYRETGMV